MPSRTMSYEQKYISDVFKLGALDSGSKCDVSKRFTCTDHEEVSNVAISFRVPVSVSGTSVLHAPFDVMISGGDFVSSTFHGSIE